MNLMTYSNVNQPTKTASAISKKSSSPEIYFKYNTQLIKMSIQFASGKYLVYVT